MSRAGTTSWGLVEAAANGEVESREEFARLYLPVVRAYLAARWRDTPLVEALEDAVQEVFLDCFRPGGALEKLNRGRCGSFKAFFYGVVRNIARRTERSRARGRERQPRATNDMEVVAAREKAVSGIFEERWALAVLRQAVERHEEIARAQGADALGRVELLRLRFQEGLPIRQIAVRREVDPARLHKEYARARREFKTALLEVVARQHGGTPREVERECARLLSVLA